MNEGRIGEDPVLPLAGEDILTDFDVGRQGRSEELEGLFQDLPDTDGMVFPLRFPAEGKDLPDEFLGAVSGLENLLKVASDRTILRPT